MFLPYRYYLRIIMEKRVVRRFTSHKMANFRAGFELITTRNARDVKIISFEATVNIYYQDMES
jgi:hypothetical protein